MSAAVDLQTVMARFLPAHRERHRLHPRQRTVCAHIGACRTAQLGGLVERCERCDHERRRYLSCRDRHCPKCQHRASVRWSEGQRQRLVPVTYYHLVFTVPEALNAWVHVHPRAVYNQLFESAWATLASFAESPRRLGGQLAMTAVLHTWGQTLTRHVHLHCLVPGGVLTRDGTWRSARGHYLFPVRALSRRFRGHFVGNLRRRVAAGELPCIDIPGGVDAMLDALMATEWVVYAKPCIGHTERVVDYLARYSHRIALNDARLVGIEGTRVGLRTVDYRQGRTHKIVWLEGEELVRRFLLHVLPKGFMRIRHYGFLANRCRSDRLRQIRTAIAAHATDPHVEPDRRPPCPLDIPVPCPRCRTGAMRTTATIAPTRFDGG